MKEKNGLDKSAFNNFNFNDDNSKESKDIKKMRQKVIKFNENALKCENFCWKKEEVLHFKTYWCKKINKACIFANCPKNK